MAKRSVSLLPESLAAGVSGSLDAIEAAVDAIETHGVAGAVEAIFPSEAADAIGLVGATRALRRRARWVRSTLIAIVTLLAARFAGVAPTLAALRVALNVERVLVPLREVAGRHIDALARPFGLRARVSA